MVRKPMFLRGERDVDLSDVIEGFKQCKKMVSVGDKVRIRDNRNKLFHCTGTVVAKFKRYFVVDKGKHKECFNYADFHCGKLSLKKVR